MPDVLSDVRLDARTRRAARFYAGLKENLYLDSAGVDRGVERARLGVADGIILVVARPPAASAHYAQGPGLDLWTRLVTALAARPHVRVVVSPRSASQADELRGRLTGNDGFRFLERVVPGPGLVAAADLVVGGGGTMNREAAVLGIPVWSSFTGPVPRIDARLAEEGRLRWVREPADVEAILREPLPARGAPRGPFPDGLRAIVSDVERALS
jgi:predicted glycosyltransferase